MTADILDSYDPRRWAAVWTPPVPPRARNLVGWRPIAAFAVLLVGASSAWLSRPDQTRSASPSTAVATRSVPMPGQVRRTLVLSRATDLVDALIAAGVAGDVAREAAATAAPGLKTTGEIRAALLLTRGRQEMRLDRLEASNGDSSGVIVARSADGRLTVSQVAVQLTTRILTRHGTMDGDSFYSSAIAAGVPNAVIPVFAKALAFDIDFQRDVAAGDAFEAAYAQQVNASGEAIGAPNLLYASLTTATKSAAVYRFEGEQWFDASGRSIVRSLMRTPVDGARVSSKFGMRLHPVLHFMKLHGGIDFAAPIGTPIYASGAGTIDFAGPKGANGNFVRLRHDNGWATLYLHMNRFMPGVATGARVAQGQQIGEVGTTGRSTGPHLHYEVHIDGERVDPLTVPTGQGGKTLAGAQLIAFEKVRDRIDVSRVAGAE